MLTIIHVKAALRSQDIKRANQLMKTVLKNDPCEEAFYIAARMTPHLSKKMKYIKQSLSLNPDYAPAQKLHRQLQSQHTSTFSQLWDAPFARSLKQRYDQMTRTEHTMFLGVSTFMLVTIFGLVFYFLFAPKSISLPDVESFAYIQVFNTDAIHTNLQDNQLDVAWIELQPVPGGIHAGQYLEVALQDTMSETHIVQLLIYRHYSELAQDIDYIENFSLDKSLRANKNTVMIYPGQLPTEVETRLVEAYQTMPTIDIHPRQIASAAPHRT